MTKEEFIRKHVPILRQHIWYQDAPEDQLVRMAAYQYENFQKHEPREITSATYERADRRQSQEIMRFVGGK